VFVAVPEAAVDEDDGAVFRQDEVGFARERLVFGSMDGEAVAEAVEHGAQGQLGLGIAPTDARHDLRALLRGEDVHGGVKAEN
jgi:DNA-binding transcriptional LysR family regulator